MKVASLPYERILESTEQQGLEAIVEWVEFCAANEVDGVEIAEPWLRRLGSGGVDRLIEAMGWLPLEVSALNVPDVQPNQAAGPGRNETVSAICGHLDLAGRLGTRQMVLGSGAWGYYERNRMSRDEAIGNTVETLEACLGEASARGVRLLIENHPGWLPLRAEVAERILDELPPEQVSLNLDVGAAHYDQQSPWDFLDRPGLIERIGYVHTKSLRFEGDPESGRWNQTRPLDQSSVDYKRVFARLSAAGYDGWVCYASDARVGVVGIISGADFLRRTWRATSVA